MPATLAIYCLILPFWSLPILPGTFKPIAVLFAAFISVKFFANLRTRVSPEDLLMLGYLIYASALTSIFAIFAEIPIAVDKISIFLIGFLAFFGVREIFGRANPNQITSAMTWSAIILLPFFIIETLALLKLIPEVWKIFLNQIFNGKGSTRIVLTAGEPSWAGIVFLMLFPFCYHRQIITNSGLDRLLFVFICVGFFVSFSLSAFFTAFIAATLFAIIQGKLLGYFKVLVVSISFLTLFLFVIFNMFEESYYFSSRLFKISGLIARGDLNLESFMAVDGSVLIRFSYPIIAFEIFVNNPIGSGVGSYGYLFSEYLTNNSMNALTNNFYIMSHVVNQNADARNFILQIANDTGIVGLFLLTTFYWRIYKRISNMAKKNEVYDHNYVRLLQMGFCIMVGCMFQFGTYLFPLYSLIPALVIAYDDRYRKIS